jgi:hypothetical protein
MACSLAALDTSHFYRAQFFPGEPRFERTALTTGSFIFGGGTTQCSYNHCGKKVPLLDLYGTTNIPALARGARLTSENRLDKILIDLSKLPANGTFGHLSFSGFFDIFEARLSWFQNIDKGLFWGLYLPIRTLSITSIVYTDCSPKEGFPNKTTPLWEDFLQAFPDILLRNNRSIRSVRSDGIGDVGIVAGWTRNEESYDWCDFVDLTLWGGILIPTQSPLNPRCVFALPLGYGGYTVLPLMADMSIGFCDSLTLGAHVDTHLFLQRKRFRGIKTSPDQSGMLSLVSAYGIEHKSPLWSANFYLKGDHIAGSLSLTLGYGLSYEGATTFHDPATKAPLGVCDGQYGTWHMNTLHLMAEYDFASYEAPYAPRVGVIYNRVLSGKRIFDTDIVGGSCIIEYSWGF